MLRDPLRDKDLTTGKAEPTSAHRPFGGSSWFRVHRSVCTFIREEPLYKPGDSGSERSTGHRS